MRIRDDQERLFYEREAIAQNWGKRELSRQYSSSLYERLLLSADKDQVMRIVQENAIPETVSANVKDPYVLEFLGLHEQPDYTENELESRIIDHLQEF